MRTPKILFVNSNNDELGGADYALFKLVLEISGHGYDCSVVLRRRTQIACLYEKANISLYTFPLIRIRKTTNPVILISYFYHTFSTILLLYKFIKRLRFDLIHTNDLFDFPGNIAAHFAGTPSIHHIRFIVENPFWLRKLLENISVRFSSRSVCVSENVKNVMFVDHPEHALVIYDWIDAEPNGHNNHGPNLHTELGLGSNVRLIGCVGRLEQIKGQHIFINAAQLVAREIDDVHFLIVGGTTTNKEDYLTYLMDLKRNSDYSDRITYLGHRDDMENIMGQLSVMVQASTANEAFGLVVMEAMNSGALVVAPDRGGAREQVIGGITGYLYEPGNHKDMAAKIIRALKTSEANQMTSYAKEFVRKKFNKQENLGKILSLYSELL
jgi:glycosyltransferase involved in cell wall biosynthesis